MIMYSKKKLMKTIITLSLLGLIPFYLENIFSILEINYYLPQNIKLIYGSMIVSFLSGMQWQRFIEQKINSGLKFILPMLNFIWTWSYIFKFLNPVFIIISGLILSLFIDLFIQKKFIDYNFNKVRILATILAIFSFFV